MFGPDVTASLTGAELRQLCDGIRFTERMERAPVDKTTVDDRMTPLRDIFFKSVVPLDDFPAGTALTRTMLGIKKPGTGIPAARIGEILAVDLPRPRERLALAHNARFMEHRAAVLEFLYEKQAHKAKLKVA